MSGPTTHSLTHKVSKYTAAQKLEQTELAMAKQDINAARDCMCDAAELEPQVANTHLCAPSRRAAQAKLKSRVAVIFATLWLAMSSWKRSPGHRLMPAHTQCSWARCSEQGTGR